MLNVPVYNESGEKVASREIDEAWLGGEVNAALLKQAIVMYHANQRQGTVAQLTRAEVEGSTRKLYRQKGTGRARAGNVRTPVRRGGGAAFAKKPREFRQEMPRKMRRLARNQAVLSKIQDERALIVDGLKFDTPKTARFAAMLKALQAGAGCVFALRGTDENVFKSGRNIPGAEIADVASLNARQILTRKNLIFTADAFDAFVESVRGAAKVSE